ncbi:hypothetical protein OPT61_g4017 [Boeremia exigua]|uniref:Uncharacterized protein n=1 Tax=Boeremia exigua TaxID=749465 RepID=A0ACC2IFS4_9PLEO|nr:hypothetical protein OPT61_g4017 [Boeremia exigua]
MPGYRVYRCTCISPAIPLDNNSKSGDGRQGLERFSTATHNYPSAQQAALQVTESALSAAQSLVGNELEKLTTAARQRQDSDIRTGWGQSCGRSPAEGGLYTGLFAVEYLIADNVLKACDDVLEETTHGSLLPCNASVIICPSQAADSSSALSLLPLRGRTSNVHVVSQHHRRPPRSVTTFLTTCSQQRRRYKADSLNIRVSFTPILAKAVVVSPAPLPLGSLTFYEAENVKLNPDSVSLAHSGAPKELQIAVKCEASPDSLASIPMKRKREDAGRETACTKAANDIVFSAFPDNLWHLGQYPAGAGTLLKTDMTLSSNKRDPSSPYSLLKLPEVNVDYVDHPFPGMSHALTGTYVSTVKHQARYHQFNVQVFKSPADDVWWAIFSQSTMSVEGIDTFVTIRDGYFRIADGPKLTVHLDAPFLLEWRIQDIRTYKVHSGPGTITFGGQGATVVTLFEVPTAKAPVQFTGFREEGLGLVADLQKDWNWFMDRNTQQVDPR